MKKSLVKIRMENIRSNNKSNKQRLADYYRNIYPLYMGRFTDGLSNTQVIKLFHHR